LEKIADDIEANNLTCMVCIGKSENTEEKSRGVIEKKTYKTGNSRVRPIRVLCPTAKN